MVLIASGGHTHLALVPRRGEYRFIGWTMDDAAGEAFDKGAKMLGLPYPGGPAIDKLAEIGNAQFVSFPRPNIHSQDFNFSFSGLKTALRYFLRDKQQKENSPLPLADVAASYQEAIVEVLVEKLCRAARHYDAKGISVVGGVAANSRLRLRLKERAQPLGLEVTLPPLALCTDNAAMIAAAGWEKLKRKERIAWEVDAISTLQCKHDVSAMAGIRSLLET
jgi:N6-L-threonylcarbamoyladenine synthase